ncbi:MAG: PaaI family thioesterase [Actinomycetales bacterium]
MSGAAESGETAPADPVNIIEESGTAELIERVRTPTPDTLTYRMGIEILQADAQCVVGTMPVAGNTQPFGLLHGGASAVLAETLGSIGSALHAGPGYQPVGTELTCTHHRAARQGLVLGTARPLHLGRTLATYDIRIQDEDGRAICTARLTCMIRPKSTSE